MEFKLPDLPFAYDALEPFIDAKTMQIHHRDHHGAYVAKLNAALASYPEWKGIPLDALLSALDRLPPPLREEVRNNGGGHYNHSFFWKTLAPKGNGGVPSVPLASSLTYGFGSLSRFKDVFETEAKEHFASGWAWLGVDAEGFLVVQTLPDHEWPQARHLRPLLVLDLWEHAYYLKYQAHRDRYAAAFWNVVNWTEVGQRFSRIQGQVHSRHEILAAFR